MSRRRRQQRLERVLGTPALFATAYGNVGSSIYYALGVTAVFALGLTPLVFVIAGIIFAATAATYAEGTVRYPEAGGSSSFARHAFNEVVSFGAAWAQMLNYVITIAISAFFVPHYLSIFWGPLRENPWDIVGGAVVIVLLVALNIVGIQESARINVVLAAIDFATQVLLVLLGFVLVFSPHTLVRNVHFGTAPTWSHFLLAIPIGMIAYTGIETVSNLSEEARDPLRSIPRSILMVAIAVFAIYFTLPMIALSAMPVKHGVTVLGLNPPKGFAADPVLGVVEHLGIAGSLLSVLKVYVGLLAATILFIATNAGVIGASRITYAMAGYRQLPTLFRRLHPKFKTPWIALVVFAGFISILVLIPGKTNFLGTMYSFGAMLSFTIAHASVIQLRRLRAGEDIPWKARPNFRWRGVDWPLFAVVGLLGTGLSWLDVVIQYPSTRYAGLGWLAIGFLVYVVYRRRVLDVPLSETVRAPVEYGPGPARGACGCSADGARSSATPSTSSSATRPAASWSPPRGSARRDRVPPARRVRVRARRGRARDRPPRRDGRAGRRHDRLPPRRALRRARLRTPLSLASSLTRRRKTRRNFAGRKPRFSSPRAAWGAA